MNRTILFLCLLTAMLSLRSQPLYQESFGLYSLTSYTTGTHVAKYAALPVKLQTIEDYKANNIGSLSNLNSPFHVPALKNNGWILTYNAQENDTFAVCTSWLDDATQTIDRWMVTDTVKISQNTVITWLAKSPDAGHPDGYELYATEKTGTLTSADFTLGDKLFALPDGNTAGGGEKDRWTRRSFHAGNYFNGKKLRFAFRNNSKNMYQLWIDDISVFNAAANTDAALVALDVPKYIRTNTSQTVSVRMRNEGASDISTLVMQYRYGNGSVNTQTFILTNTLTCRQETMLSFPQLLNISSSDMYELKVWITKVNGEPSALNGNDTVRMNICALANAPLKTVLTEQFISANDPEGPDAQERGRVLEYSGGLVVNIHDNDMLEETSCSTLMTEYMKQSSTGMMDRAYFSDLDAITIPRTDYYGKLFQRKDAVSPVRVDIMNPNYSPVTKNVSFQVKATFSVNAAGDYRLGAYLTENNVCGDKNDTTINGYNQLSNYYNIPWSPFFQTGYYAQGSNCWVMDAWRFKHNNTLVHAFDGPYGTSGVIPPAVSNGNAFLNSYFFTVPTVTAISKFNTDNMYIVGFIYEHDADTKKRTILNATRVKLTANPEVVGSMERIVAEERVRIFPNPVNEALHIEVGSVQEECKVTMLDISGRKLSEQLIPSGGSVYSIDCSGLADGVYLLELRTHSKTVVQKIMVQH